MKAESKPALWPSPRLDLARHRKDELKPLKCICVHHGARCHGGPGALDVERKTCHMWCTIARRPMVGPHVMVFPHPGLGLLGVFGTIIMVGLVRALLGVSGILSSCFMLAVFPPLQGQGVGKGCVGMGREAPGRRRSANREPGPDIVVCYSHLPRRLR